MATSLLAALEEVQNDKTLTEKFISDPNSVLSSLGIDTSGLQIHKNSKKSSAGVETSAALNVCGSVGMIACVSVGKEL